MTFNKIIDLISPNISLQVISGNNDFEISDVSFMDDSMIEYSPNVIYFDYLPNVFDQSDYPLQCILGSAQPLDKMPEMPADVNCAIVDQTQFFLCFNTMRTLIENSNKNTELFNELLKKISRARNLNEVLNIAALKMGNPIIFMDSNFTILDYSTVFPITDACWAANIAQGYCNFEFITAVQRLDAVKNAPESEEPFDVTYEYRSPSRKIISKLFFKGKQIGCLLLLEKDTAITVKHFEMLKTFNHVLENYIPKLMPYIFFENSVYQQILHNILIGATPKEISHYFAQLKTPANFVVFAVKAKEDSLPKDAKYRLFISFRERFPTLPVVVHENTCVGLYILDKTIKLSDDVVASLKSFSAAQSAMIGLSNTFSDLEELKYYYMQAAAAIKFGRQLDPGKGLFSYAQYQFYDLMLCFNEAEHLKYFRHPALSILQEYDEKYNYSADLYHTLGVYLQCNCSTKKTAERLFVHRNTMRYRLSKIIELTDLDLEDSHTAFLLLQSYYIDHYLEKISLV